MDRHDGDCVLNWVTTLLLRGVGPISVVVFI